MLVLGGSAAHAGYSEYNIINMNYAYVWVAEWLICLFKGAVQDNSRKDGRGFWGIMLDG